MFINKKTKGLKSRDTVPLKEPNAIWWEIEESIVKFSEKRQTEESSNKKQKRHLLNGWLKIEYVVART